MIGANLAQVRRSLADDACVALARRQAPGGGTRTAKQRINWSRAGGQRSSPELLCVDIIRRKTTGKAMRLETSRLVIRSLVEEDLGLYAAIVGDPNVTKYLLQSAPRSIEQARDEILEYINMERLGGASSYAVTLRGGDEFVGVCGFKNVAERLVFGFRLASKYWGAGYATEAANAILDYGLRQLEMGCVHAGAHPNNTQSLKILAKLGFVQDTTDISASETWWFVKIA
jgi:[ribosomal protein S5]-alanine N-acetyltransferase